MPPVGWECPEHGKQGWDHKCDHYLPTLRAAAEDKRTDERPKGFSPSSILGCVRQHYLKKAGGESYVGYDASVMAVGKIVHEWIQAHPDADWNYEVQVGPTAIFKEEFGETAIFWGYVDRLSRDGLTVVDVKTSEPYGDVSDSEGAAQLNIYGRVLRGDSKSQLRLKLEFVGRGAKPVFVPWMSDAALLSFTPGSGQYSIRQKIQHHLAFAKSGKWEDLPLEGRSMYVSSRKGTNSCSRCLVREACERLANEEL